MASNRMSDDQKKDVNHAIDKLLGRGVKFFTCPLQDPAQALAIVNARVSPELIAAAQVIYTEKMALSTMRTFTVPYMTHHAQLSLCLHVPAGITLVAYTAWTDTTRRKTMAVFDQAEISKLVSVEFAEEFDSWAHNMNTFTREAKEAATTISAVVKMAMTPGQLRRMMPDLVQYMPDELQTALKARVRASLVPFEWAAFQREPVYRAAETLAKCHLLPHSNVQWSTRGQFSWVSP